MIKATAVTILAASAVLALGGCGGSSNDSKAPANAPATSSSAPAAGAGAPIDGCTETQTDELYVRKLYACDSKATNVYTFDSTEQRDNWWKVAQAVGAVQNGQGPTWMEVKQ